MKALSIFLILASTLPQLASAGSKKKEPQLTTLDCGKLQKVNGNSDKNAPSYQIEVNGNGPNKKVVIIEILTDGTVKRYKVESVSGDEGYQEYRDGEIGQSDFIQGADVDNDLSHAMLIDNEGDGVNSCN